MCLPGLARRMPATRFCRCCKMKESTAHHQMVLRSSDLFRSVARIEYDASIILPRACHAECALRPFLAAWDCEGQNPVTMLAEKRRPTATVYTCVPYE